MPRLSCKVSKRLLDEIKRIQIDHELKSRGATLEYILDQAIQNIGDQVDIEDFGKHDHKECYVELKKKKIDDSTPYRKHYLLTGKKEFLLHVICHGVAVIGAANAAQLQPENTKVNSKIPGNDDEQEKSEPKRKNKT